MNFKKIICSIPLLCAVFLQNGAYATSNEIHELKIGDCKVIAVKDTSFEMAATLIVNGNPDTLKKYLPDGKTISSVNTFIIKNGKQTILVDAGNGASMLTNLKKVGLTPDSINLILITHGHFDHVSGLIKDGKPVFQKAKVLFSKDEKALYEDKAIESIPDEYKTYFKASNQVFKIYGDKVGTFAFGDTVASGVISVDLHGHTAGQTGYLVESKGQKLLIAGDFLHISPVQFPHPEYSLVYDRDPVAAATTRKLVLDNVTKEKMLVAGMHIPFPGVGTVALGPVGFVFSPVK
jgi:glyoxylase-like metal-dependent hydrolase (beta-lactamase superfamily II)